MTFLHSLGATSITSLVGWAAVGASEDAVCSKAVQYWRWAVRVRAGQGGFGVLAALGDGPLAGKGAVELPCEDLRLVVTDRVGPTDRCRDRPGHLIGECDRVADVQDGEAGWGANAGDLSAQVSVRDGQIAAFLGEVDAAERTVCRDVQNRGGVLVQCRADFPGRAVWAG